MPDTQRSVSQIQSLLADNSSGDISPADARDVAVSCYQRGFGSIYVKDGSTAQTGIGTSYAPVTGFAADGEASLATPDHTADSITIDESGVWAVSFHMSFSGTASTLFTFCLFVDDVEDAFAAAVALDASGSVATVSLTGILSLAAAEEVTIKVKADGASKSITPIHSQLTVERRDSGV